MPWKSATAGLAALVLASGCTIKSESETPAQAEGSAMESTPPYVAPDHAVLLASDDPQLAANKRLVYDMYRIVLQAGLADRAGEFIREDYIQHNPNAASGLAALQDYVRKTRPEREVLDRIELPLTSIVAERNMVMMAFVRPETDADGNRYHSTWFDLFRIEDGMIAEHWDPMLRSDQPLDPNDQKL